LVFVVLDIVFTMQILITKNKDTDVDNTT